MECTVTVTGSIDQPTIHWLDDGVEIASSDATRNVSEISINEGSYSSTLTFTPLAVSDEGVFVCRVMIEEVIKNHSITITVRSE